MDSCRVDNEERRYAEEQLAIFVRSGADGAACRHIEADGDSPASGYFVQDVDFRFGICVAVRVILPERRRFKAEPA